MESKVRYGTAGKLGIYEASMQAGHAAWRIVRAGSASACIQDLGGERLVDILAPTR